MTSTTRRSWMVNIGQAVAGVGLAGHSHGEETSAAQFPPGVYGPSSDHLGHALMNAEAYHSIPAGCPTDYVRPRSGAFEPQFFSAVEFPIVRRLTELLLGEVSPELSQEIAEWIDLRVASSGGVRRAELRLKPPHRALAAAYYREASNKALDAAKICRDGLAWLPADFLSRETTTQIALLESVSDERVDKHLENVGTRLFDYLKAEIIRGYYTSRVGLKELDFKGNAFYARSPGCGV